MLPIECPLYCLLDQVIDVSEVVGNVVKHFLPGCNGASVEREGDRVVEGTHVAAIDDRLDSSQQVESRVAGLGDVELRVLLVDLDTHVPDECQLSTANDEVTGQLPDRGTLELPDKLVDELTPELDVLPNSHCLKITLLLLVNVPRLKGRVHILEWLWNIGIHT